MKLYRVHSANGSSAYVRSEGDARKCAAAFSQGACGAVVDRITTPPGSAGWFALLNQEDDKLAVECIGKWENGRKVFTRTPKAKPAPAGAKQ